VWDEGNIGSSGAAASAVEIVGSVLALCRGELPPTRNCDNLDPVCAINVHRDGTRPVAKPYVVKLNYTDMGQVGSPY
jgi:3-oxoacyl-(acyl-carrier-protein) synthase